MLVGYARAVGDDALVATIHDVAVLPELRGRGLGRQLLDRLTKQVGGRPRGAAGRAEAQRRLLLFGPAPTCLPAAVIAAAQPWGF